MKNEKIANVFRYVVRFIEVYMLFYFIIFTGFRYQIARPEILATQSFILMILMVAWLIYLLVQKGSPGLPVNPGVYLVYAGFYLSSLFGSVDIGLSLPEGYLFFVACFLFVGVLSLIRYGWNRRDLLDSLLWVGLIYTVMKGTQIIVGIPEIGYCSRQDSIVANKSGGFLALVMVVSLAIWLTRKDRKERLALITFIGSTVVWFMIGSRGAYIGGFAGVAVVLLIHTVITGRWKWKNAVLVVSALLVLPMIGTVVFRPLTCLAVNEAGEIEERDSRYWNYNIATRGRLWGTAFDVFREYPLRGAGPGTFPLYTGPGYDYRKYMPHSHSIYMNVLAERGLIGLVMSGIVIVSMLQSLLFGEMDPVYKLVGVGVLAVTLGQGAVDVVLSEPFVMRYLFVVLAVAVGPNLDNGG